VAFPGVFSRADPEFERFVGKPNESPQGMHDRLYHLGKAMGIKEQTPREKVPGGSQGTRSGHPQQPVP